MSATNQDEVGRGAVARDCALDQLGVTLAGAFSVPPQAGGDENARLENAGRGKRENGLVMDRRSSLNSRHTFQTLIEPAVQVVVCIYSYIAIITWFIVSYFILLFMTCFSVVVVGLLHYLYRAPVNALFSLVVLFITYCVEKSHFIQLFDQIKKEKKKRKKEKG